MSAQISKDGKGIPGGACGRDAQRESAKEKRDVSMATNFEIEKGKYGLSTAALLCFLCGRKDPEVLDLVRQFRKKLCCQIR